MSSQISIRCLPSNFDAQSLLRLCSSFGDVASFEPRSSGTGNEEGKECTADVQFEEAEDALAAAGNMNGMEFGGKHLRVFVKHAVD
ncbi:hypothetical protein BCY84_17498 [Trypanosoma cruzi cruzi]|nr:hypothetical protein BCY84_17498 [Trypanosoma cruzi cruzi]